MLESTGARMAKFGSVLYVAEEDVRSAAIAL